MYVNGSGLGGCTRPSQEGSQLGACPNGSCWHFYRSSISPVLGLCTRRCPRTCRHHFKWARKKGRSRSDDRPGRCLAFVHRADRSICGATKSKWAGYRADDDSGVWGPSQVPVTEVDSEEPPFGVFAPIPSCVVRGRFEWAAQSVPPCRCPDGVARLDAPNESSCRFANRTVRGRLSFSRSTSFAHVVPHLRCLRIHG